MESTKKINPSRNQQGSALLEALIGILIFSIGVLSLIGLQATSIKLTTDAKDRTDASLFANQVISRMWVDQGNLASYAVTDQPIAGLPDGTRTVEVSGTQVTVTISWRPPNSAARHRYVTVTHVTS
jgi:type IV pilus assembly protein PilV